MAALHQLGCVAHYRSSEEYNVLKISLEGQIEELERTFEAAHQAYLQNTGARATAFHSLTTNDAAAARVIEQRMKKLVQMQVLLLHPAHTLNLNLSLLSSSIPSHPHNTMTHTGVVASSTVI